VEIWRHESPKHFNEWKTHVSLNTKEETIKEEKIER
jgi:hypothetical protein